MTLMMLRPLEKFLAHRSAAFIATPHSHAETLARYRVNVKRARQEINWVQEEKKLVTVYNEVFEAAYGENSV